MVAVKVSVCWVETWAGDALKRLVVDRHGVGMLYNILWRKAIRDSELRSDCLFC